MFRAASRVFANRLLLFLSTANEENGRHCAIRVRKLEFKDWVLSPPVPSIILFFQPKKCILRVIQLQYSSLTHGTGTLGSRIHSYALLDKVNLQT
ncbi:hypothetical protein DFH11DRAFT_1605187 [Phellopilus nigrolimitatus]|nr:hypothetical protein DFH11DRAFT_1605187 [Phellopilus nigrolimitatus]